MWIFLKFIFSFTPLININTLLAMLEDELEVGFPSWLKVIINDIISLLEKYIHGCDAFGRINDATNQLADYKNNILRAKLIY